MALFKNFTGKNYIYLNQIYRTTKTIPIKKTMEWRKEIAEQNTWKYKSRSNDVEADSKTLLTCNKSIETIEVPDSKVVDIISGVPEEHIKSRLVRIFMPSKNAMQSGTFGTRNWRIEFDQRERWDNNLIGWTSTGDPLSNTSLEFDSAESAANYCTSMGLNYQIEIPNKPILKPKSYGANFSWNKRSRVTTK